MDTHGIIPSFLLFLIFRKSTVMLVVEITCHSTDWGLRECPFDLHWYMYVMTGFSILWIPQPLWEGHSEGNFLWRMDIQKKCQWPFPSRFISGVHLQDRPEYRSRDQWLIMPKSIKLETIHFVCPTILGFDHKSFLLPPNRLKSMMTIQLDSISDFHTFLFLGVTGAVEFLKPSEKKTKHKHAGTSFFVCLTVWGNVYLEV